MRPFRLFLLLTSLLWLAIATGSAQAASSRTCPSAIELTRPAAGATISSIGETSFRWSGEPSKAVRREWVLIGVTNGADGTAAPSGEQAREEALPFKHKAKTRLQAGSYNWFVVFYDAKGRILCTSSVGSFSVGKHKGPALGEAGSLVSHVEVRVLRNYIVVLFDSPYLLETNHPSDLLLADGVTGYDASGLNLKRYSGVTIYGNDAANTLTGSARADIIYGYAGNDTLNGGDGNDILYGGDESCTGFVCSSGTLGRLGDTLNGGNGNDTLNGGNESCTGEECNRIGALGDTLNGGDGNDTLNGGNESCTGKQCNYNGRLADTLNGGNGKDTLNGGNESCAGVSCNYHGTVGDTLNGGDGNDSGTGGTEGCTGSFCHDFEVRSEDVIVPSGGIDTIVP